MNAFTFYRAQTHLFDFPIPEPLETLCARGCEDCGAPRGIVCVSECPAALDEVWRLHAAMVTVRLPGCLCPFCGEVQRCIGGKFMVRLSDGIRQYTIRNYGMMALGAFVVYQQFIHTGSWPTGSVENGQADGELPLSTRGGSGGASRTAY
jgi:hypothetical protein